MSDKYYNTRNRPVFEIGRAFSAWGGLGKLTQRDALGWYEAGPLALSTPAIENLLFVIADAIGFRLPLTCVWLCEDDNLGMKTVAVIGASANRSKYGNKAVRAYARQGYTVYPVNSRETEIEGWPAYKSILEVPGRPEMISVYVPPATVLRLLADIAKKGCDELWLNPGTESDEVLAEAERLGLHVIQACSIIGAGVSPASL